MQFMNWLIQGCNDASSFFYSIYLEVLGWVYPFRYAAGFFYQLCLIFNDLAWDFYYFNQWVDDVAAKVGNILSWSTIWSYILSNVPNLTAIRDWFYSWWNNVLSAVNSWWASTQNTVTGWIASAQSYLQNQINSLNTWFTNLQAQINALIGNLPSFNEILSWFADWWSNVLGKIIAWGALPAQQIQSLIDSAFGQREPFWAGWQDIRDNVIEFFSDPLEWLWLRFTNWFLGKE